MERKDWMDLRSFQFHPPSTCWTKIIHNLIFYLNHISILVWSKPGVRLWPPVGKPYGFSTNADTIQPVYFQSSAMQARCSTHGAYFMMMDNKVSQIDAVDISLLLFHYYNYSLVLSTKGTPRTSMGRPPSRKHILTQSTRLRMQHFGQNKEFPPP
jgi:hypothetical protein